MSKRKVRLNIDFITDERPDIEVVHDDLTEDTEGQDKALPGGELSTDEKIRAAQEQLARLRLQQEEIDRQKKHLKLLHFKQESFVAGKREILSNIERGIDLVEEQLLLVQFEERRSPKTSGMFRSKKRVENLTEALELLNKHREVLKSLQPEKWHRCELDRELDSALSAIENAYDYYHKFIQKEGVLFKELNPNILALEDTWHGRHCRLFASGALGMMVVTAFTGSFPTATIVLAISAAACTVFAAMHFYRGLKEMAEDAHKSERMWSDPNLSE